MRAAFWLVAIIWCGSAGAAPSWQQVSAALDYTPHGTQPGLTTPLFSSEGCHSCHRANSGADAAFTPYETWAGSMMANATRDPVFWAALDVANHDQPGVGDYCLRCHTPRGWYAGHVVKVGDGSTIDGSDGCKLVGNYGETDNGDAQGLNDYSGESCHYCHRLMSQGPQGQAAMIGNANAWLDDGDCNGVGEPCRRGPYDYPAGSAVDSPPHAWAYSSYHQQSAQCGLCHDVSTPDTSAGPLKFLRDAGGNVTTTPFPAERTFSEWRHSDFADVVFRDGLGDVPALARSKQCQDCHMPQSTDPNAYACTFDTPGARAGNLATHAFAGGNAWVPTILSGEYGAALNRTDAFAQTVSAAQQMLAGAAQVALTQTGYGAPNASTAGSLALRVRVTNLSGHKLPSGYAEGRRMWLDVQVRDANGALLAESGAYDASSATLGNDAQLRVYEVLQGMWGMSACQVNDGSGNAQFHFVLNDCIAKDSRIPPLGFTGAADPETQPVNFSFATQGTRLVNYDDAPYTFVLPAGTALPVTASATLYYQTSSRPYIEFLRNQAQVPGQPFQTEQDLCSASRSTPFQVGPQQRTRAQYLYELWNNAAGDAQPGYGKSPPQVSGNVATATVGN